MQPPPGFTPMPIVFKLCAFGMTLDLAYLLDSKALAETGSFSRAAFVRNVTQPAFSRRIRALEDWAGGASLPAREHTGNVNRCRSGHWPGFRASDASSHAGGSGRTGRRGSKCLVTAFCGYARAVLHLLSELATQP